MLKNVKCFTLMALLLGLTEVHSTVNVISPGNPSIEEMNFVDTLISNKIIEIDGEQEFIDFIKQQLYIIAHNKVGLAMLIDIYDTVCRKPIDHIVITPTFYEGSCCWPSKKFLQDSLADASERIPEYLQKLTAAGDNCVVVEVDRLYKASERADESKIVGFSKRYGEAKNNGIMPIDDTPDLTIFHELNHGRIFLKAISNSAELILSEALSTLNPNSGSLDTPIYVTRNGKKVGINNIMENPMEEVQLIGYTEYIDNDGIKCYTDPICENAYRIKKESEENIRYPYLHDLWDGDVRVWFFEDINSKQKIIKKSIENAEKI